MGKLRFNIQSLTLFLIFLAISPETTESQRHGPLPIQFVPPRPLCASQFTLANYACAYLPYISAPPLPPPAPPTPGPPEPSNESREHSSGHGGRRHHGHGHRSDTPATQEEQNCCRWLKEIDTECVCDLLVHLPVFLAKPVHAYTVSLHPACNVTYLCGGRIRP